MKKIRSMSLVELIKARAEISAAIEVHAARDRQSFLQIVSQIGHVINGRKSGPSPRSSALKGKKLKARYRNPKNHDETWAGRGLKPRWLANALKAGAKLESFAIK